MKLVVDGCEGTLLSVFLDFRSGVGTLDSDRLESYHRETWSRYVVPTRGRAAGEFQ